METCITTTSQSAPPIPMAEPAANEKLASGVPNSLSEANALQTETLTVESWQGNDSMHARYYSPHLGRFLSVDPVGGSIGSSQSWNRYSYVLNNPVKLVDPTGMAHLDPNSTEDEIIWIGDAEDEVVVTADDPIDDVDPDMLRIAGGGATVEEVPWNPEPAIELSFSSPSVPVPPLGIHVLGDVTASVTPSGMTVDFSLAPGYSKKGQASAMFTGTMTFGNPTSLPATSVDFRGGSGAVGGGVGITTDAQNYTAIKCMFGFGAGGRIKLNHGHTIPLFTISREW